MFKFGTPYGHKVNYLYSKLCMFCINIIIAFMYLELHV